MGFTLAVSELRQRFTDAHWHIDTAGRYFKEGGSIPMYIDAAIGSPFAITVLTALTALWGALSRKEFLLDIAGFFGMIAMIVLAVAVTVEVPTSVAFADFCHAGPLHSTVLLEEYLLPAESFPTAKYYTLCSGVNPLDYARQSGRNASDLVVERASALLHGDPANTCSD